MHGRPTTADVSMRRAALKWRGGFFQALQWDRIFFFANGGLWAYPALVREDGEVRWLHIMFAVAPSRHPLFVKILAPRALAWTTPNKGTVIRFEDLRYSTGTFSCTEPTFLGIHPWSALRSMSVRDFAAFEGTLMLLYPAAEEQFLAAGTVPGEFRAAYRSINHPCLFRFLAIWAAEFYAAVS